MSWQVIEADCVEAMREMDEASVDAICTDPPYGLEFMGKEWDRIDAWRDGGSFTKPGIGERQTPWASFGGETANPSCRRCGGRARGAKKCACAEPDWHVRGEDFKPGDSDRARSRRMQEWHQAWATEALRVLKPGGHLLAFGGTRTYHRLACAVEDAGFEIRDSVIWLYGSGFPKSLDVSKAIDKRRDDQADVRQVCRFLRRSIDDSGETVKSIAARFGFHPRMVEHWAARDSDSQPTLPTLEQWDALRDLLAFDDEFDAEVLRLNLRKGEPGEAWADRPVTGEVEEWANRTNYALTSRDGLRRDAPATPEAQRWQGWGTALAPSHEPIVVARKPLIGTVAANVQKCGTGAINIDGSRVSSGPSTALGRWPKNTVISHHPSCERVGERRVKPGNGSGVATRGLVGDEGATSLYGFGGGDETPRGHTDSDGLETVEAWRCATDENGRNICPVAELDRQSGAVGGGDGKDWSSGPVHGTGDGTTFLGEKATGQHYGDQGGASRFFATFGSEGRCRACGRLNSERKECRENPCYGWEVDVEAGGNSRFRYVAKASRAERNAGLEGFEERKAAPGSFSDYAEMTWRNHHPTVKPVDLMRWLVRLVTPPDGVVLDPFAGSGTTGIACALEDFDFIGIEREAEYVEIARARIAWWDTHKDRADEILALSAKSERERTAHVDAGQLGLLE